jgi:RimJ/RimL family protein N-acetyltransferase
MGTIPTIRRALKDGREVVLRSATEADAEAYLALAKSVMTEEIYLLTSPDELNPTIEQERDWIRSNRKKEGGLVLCAEVEGRLVGQLDFSNGGRRRIAHTGDFGMAIHSEFRELGIGSLLLEALLEWARQNPLIEKVNLLVHANNARAIAAYTKHGFVIEGRRTRDLKYPDGVYIDSLLMGLWVGS